ncbi:Alpha/Beta hydrolase protein [Ephemerocybe angulata]|uniref:Dipeptidyl-peptidase V n=1 Tax=Ephemerocybe angulata TaxID=980116 RepID=A0A8H6I1X8_9AGAR|nr:Alpha/Beta hydrolase protein [Tulosesus angulatus]
MRFPIPFLGLTAQIPLGPGESMSAALTATPTASPKPFAFKEGADTFSPNDLVSLGRPGAAVANGAGDLALVSYSKYDLDEKKNHKSILVVALESDVKPVQINLDKGGETFWLNDRTIGNVVEGEDGSELYSWDLELNTDPSSPIQWEQVRSPQLVGKFPTKTPANFRLLPQSTLLVFSDYVYDDGNLTSVGRRDKDWQDRGNSAYVYDSTFVRHWDEWQGLKRPQLFSVALTQGEDKKWALGETFYTPLKGTGHVRVRFVLSAERDDFDVSLSHILYTTKDPLLPEAWHTKQNVYIVDIKGESAPRELTSGKQGAIHNPVFSTSGAKAAWLELDEDGYESDRAKIVIYDLEKDVRFTITQSWDRSPSEIIFSKDDDFIYLTAGDEAKVKVFALPVPPTPSESSTHPRLDAKYTTPVPLTHSRAATGIQVLPNDRLIFSQPVQLTHLTKAELESKHMSEGEEFWFEGARHKQGYFVILINPTGSTTFGQEFTDAIAEDWGGAPFIDMSKGWKYALEKYPEIDGDRAVAAGASWGGYAINWIQGHPEYGFNFKARHTGLLPRIASPRVFDSNYNGYSTDELFFFNHEWGGKPWDAKSKKLSEKYSPSNFVHKWSTPQLLIHGSKDYRLPETEGIAAFHALQQRGVESRLVIFPDENHWVLNHGNSLKWHFEVLRWFDHFVGAS